MDERELPTNKIHDYITWPTTKQIFDDGRGGLAFPEQNNSNCYVDDNGQRVSDEGKPVSVTVDASVTYAIDDSGVESPVRLDEIIYQPSYNVVIQPDVFTFRVTSFTFANGHGEITLADNLSSNLKTVLQQQGARLVANTPDSLECTTLVSAQLDLDFSAIHDNVIPFSSNDIKIGGTELRFDWSNNVSFDLSVTLLPINTELYVYLSNQKDNGENGVYCYTNGNVRRVANIPYDSDADERGLDALHDSTVCDNVECGDHYRKSYSHQEVYNRVSSDVGYITKFGVKSMAVSHCDGGLVDWFLSSGKVNIGNGHASVFVDGFGLGSLYNITVENANSQLKLPNDDYNENDNTLHPWMEWAYGTRYDATALPKDWPFTGMTSDRRVFDSVYDTNNITLVKKCDAGVGNLERDVEELVNGQTVKTHIFNNRHHIVLYPDYSPISGEEAVYPNGSVVVKPLFIHLPASLDTKDGETVDITLSIQNVDQSVFGTPNTAEALSGYYAAVSQPRVYVMGGSQKFSNKKIYVTGVPTTGSKVVDGKTVNTFTIASSNLAYANDGSTLLDVDTDVRANIVVSNHIGTTRNFTAHGTVVTNDNAAGLTIEFIGDFPYKKSPTQSKDLSFAICGMAYLDELDNPTNTKMGLISRDADLLAGDSGNGSSGELNEFNRFYSVNSDDEARTSIKQMDKRFVLATVYQTATSTFPWAITHRKKLSALSRSWTDELHRDRTGKKSLFHLIYDENQKFFTTFKSVLGTLYAISAKDSPLMYATSYDSWKTLGSRLRVNIAGHYDDDPIITADGNPVRMAVRAVQTLVSDFRKMRLLSYTQRKARVKPDSVFKTVAGVWPDAEEQPSWDTIGTPPISSGWKADLVNSIWCSKLRELPEYIYAEDSSYAEPIFNSDWFDYIANADLYNVGCDEYSIQRLTETLPYGASSLRCTKYSGNSVVGIFDANMKTDQKIYMDDIRRYSETVLGVKIQESKYMDLGQLGEPYNDWMNPFTNIQSLDTVPYPSVDLQTLANLSASQQEYASADAVQMYRFEYDDPNDAVQTVSSVMPTESDVAKFIEHYVAAYNANCDLHQYQGSRVQLQDGQFPEADNDIYIRTIDRMKKRMIGQESQIDRYLNDCFCNINYASRDPNVDRAFVNYPSIGVSAPPYMTPHDAQNQTYTRVIMQFTFSQKAGRWFTTGYRQYPTNYLSPLYGANALNAKLPSLYTSTGQIAVTIDESTETVTNDVERPIWRQSCNMFTSYGNHLYAPYSDVPPMDITLGCVPYLLNHGQCVYDFETKKILSEYDSADDTSVLLPLDRLEEPYLPVADGGLGLYPPANVNGGHAATTDDGVHANFWSVRKYIRPAVSVLSGTDIPGTDVRPISGDPVPLRSGGLISDATLYSMFNYPTAGTVEYKTPDPIDPDDDSAPM